MPNTGEDQTRKRERTAATLQRIDTMTSLDDLLAEMNRRRSPVLLAAARRRIAEIKHGRCARCGKQVTS